MGLRDYQFDETYCAVIMDPFSSREIGDPAAGWQSCLAMLCTVLNGGITIKRKRSHSIVDTARVLEMLSIERQYAFNVDLAGTCERRIVTPSTCSAEVNHLFQSLDRTGRPRKLHVFAPQLRVVVDWT